MSTEKKPLSVVVRNAFKEARIPFQNTKIENQSHVQFEKEKDLSRLKIFVYGGTTEEKHSLLNKATECLEKVFLGKVTILEKKGFSFVVSIEGHVNLEIKSKPRKKKPLVVDSPTKVLAEAIGKLSKEKQLALVTLLHEAEQVKPNFEKILKGYYVISKKHSNLATVLRSLAEKDLSKIFK